MKEKKTDRSYPKNIEFVTSNEPNGSYYIHSHHFYEIYYFVCGNADYLVEGKEYHLTPHSLILLSPNVFHGVRINTSESYTRCAVHFPADAVSPERRQLLLDAFPGNGKYSSREVFYEHTASFGLQPLLEQLIASQSLPAPQREEFYEIFLEAYLAAISLSGHSLTPTSPETIVLDTITEIISYLNSHLTDHLTLDGLSEHFFISKYYMNRAFKKATGTTVIDYVIYKRVIYARQLLLNGETAENAALLSGVGDYSSFYRAFKKVFEQSPAQINSHTLL